MADSAVSSVLTNLSRLMIDEKKALNKEVQAEIQVLIDTFLYLAYILKHVEQKQGHRYGIQNWEADVVRGAHDALDLVDSFIPQNMLLKALQELVKILDSNSMAQIFPLINLIFFRPTRRNFDEYRFLKIKIKRLHQKMDDIVVSLNPYGLQNHDETRNHSSAMRHQYPPLREHLPRSSRDDVVGFEEQTQTLVDRLVNSDPRFLFSISITGMGGVGKTTLAQCIYNNAEVEHHFNIRGWVSISQRFTPKGILLELLTELRPKIDYEEANLQRLQVSQLKTVLHEYLKESRYLIVLDDIWSIQTWDFIIGILPNIKKNRSRLVLTTRNNQVAMHAGGYIHSMSSNLEQDESWNLFKMKAFQDHEDDPELEDIGEQINNKCMGLPLLVVGIGTFLSRKTWTREWQRVLSSMRPLGPRDQVDHLLDILAYSYNDLSPVVKSCFLRLSFFPMNHEIPVRKLFHIWIAGGLISEVPEVQASNRFQNMEGKAEIYLKELIDKNLVQVEKVGVDMKVKTCRVHPCIHELCILKAKEGIYLEVQSTSLNYHPSVSARHKVILSSTDHQTPAPKLRSLLFFLPQGTSTTTSLFSPHKFLNILDLNGLVFEDPLLLRTIGGFCKLRYLNLRNTKGISSLHRSMRQLHRLLMLDLRGSEIVSGLGIIRKMTCLQHLYLDKQINRRDSKPLKFDTLAQLQSIGWITQHDLLANDINKLTLLQKLKLNIVSSTEDLQRVWNGIASLNQLISFHLLGGISGNVVIPENNISILNNIAQLTLQRVSLSPGLMSIVAQYPRLTLLRLKESLVEEGCLTIDVNGFSNLEYMELSKLENLEELRMDNGNRMSKLIRLQTSQCNRLTILPDNIDEVLVAI